jgi:predicted nucleic acid-binding protein
MFMRNSKEDETMTLIGCDTGFFVELLRGSDRAVTVWKNLISGTEDRAFVSSLTLFELERLALKGKVKKENCDVLIQAIEGICAIGWISSRDILSTGARLSHGLGMPSIDALILSWFVTSDVTVIYTTDSHFEMYQKKGITIINLKK